MADQRLVKRHKPHAFGCADTKEESIERIAGSNSRADIGQNMRVCNRQQGDFERPEH